MYESNNLMNKQGASQDIFLRGQSVVQKRYASPNQFQHFQSVAVYQYESQQSTAVLEPIRMPTSAIQHHSSRRKQRHEGASDLFVDIEIHRRGRIDHIYHPVSVQEWLKLIMVI